MKFPAHSSNFTTCVPNIRLRTFCRSLLLKIQRNCPPDSTFRPISIQNMVTFLLKYWYMVVCNLVLFPKATFCIAKIKPNSKFGFSIYVEVTHMYPPFTAPLHHGCSGAILFGTKFALERSPQSRESQFQGPLKCIPDKRFSSEKWLSYNRS